jgi:hypothetical protein
MLVVCCIWEKWQSFDRFWEVVSWVQLPVVLQRLFLRVGRNLDELYDCI